MSQQLRHGEEALAGSIRKRPERGPDVWELRVFLGRDETGRVRHLSRIFRGTERNASRELGRLVSLYHGGLDEQMAEAKAALSLTWGPTTTINDAIKGWKNNGWDDLSPSTIRRYESIWETHIRNSIGKREIASLSPYDVEQFFRRLKTKGLARASVYQTRAVLHRACKLARKWSSNLLPNPIADTELPEWTLAEQSDDVRAPNVDEVRKLMDAANKYDDRLGVFVRLVAATGARRGEISAIRWNDVDWDKSKVTIDESIVGAKGGATVKAPKTRASIRTICIDGATKKALFGLRKTQAKLANECGFDVASDCFVFSTDPAGIAPPHPDNFSHGFAIARTNAGVATDVHLHSLRHFQSTVLDPVITEAQKQSRMGWATIQMARHYTDPLGEEDKKTEYRSVWCRSEIWHL